MSETRVKARFAELAEQLIELAAKHEGEHALACWLEASEMPSADVDPASDGPKAVPDAVKRATHELICWSQPTAMGEPRKALVMQKTFDRVTPYTMREVYGSFMRRFPVRDLARFDADCEAWNAGDPYPPFVKYCELVNRGMALLAHLPRQVGDAVRQLAREYPKALDREWTTWTAAAWHVGNLHDENAEHHRIAHGRINAFLASANFIHHCGLDTRTPKIPKGKKMPKKKMRGAPQRYDPREDKKVFDAWKSRAYRTYAQCGRELGLTRKQVATAIDRHKQRARRVGQ